MKHTLTVMAIGLALTVALPVEFAQALISRTFVSKNGSDSNSCAVDSPCRNLQAAHDKTSTGGEITVLDPALYGTLTITKSISIQGNGYAGVAAPQGGASILIKASANARINLRGLIVDGLGLSQHGIRFDSGGLLTIQDCVIRKHTAIGLVLIAPASRVYVSNTTVSDNSDASAFGVLIGQPIGPGGPGLRVTLSHVGIFGNGYGIVARGVGADVANKGIIWASVNDSTISGSGKIGVQATNIVAGGFVVVTVARSSIVDGLGAAIAADGPGTQVQLNQATITNNGSGWSAINGGAVRSWGNNAFSNFQGMGDEPLPIRSLQ